MKRFITGTICAALVVTACSQGSSLSGYKLACSDSSIVTNNTSYVGYTNHWQNSYGTDYRYGNLFKINTPDLEKEYRHRMIELATDLRMPGLNMQEGFLNGVLNNSCAELVNPDADQLKEALRSCGNVLVYADKDSELGNDLSRKAPESVNIGNYQLDDPDYSVIDAFVLKKGRCSIYAVVGSIEQTEKFKAELANTRNVLDQYDLKRGWFGATTHYQSVTCAFGDQLEVIGRGMNEGNSWFVFSGPYEFLSQKSTVKWIDEIGNPVVVDHGYDPLYGADDYSSLQVQIMKGTSDWMNFKKDHKGYMCGYMPEDTVLPENNGECDFYMAHTGIVRALNRVNRPFVIRTGGLADGTDDCMMLFTRKGEGFDKSAMWDAILGCRAVAVLDGNMLTGPDTFRKALEMLMIDRTYIEDYFADKVNMLAHMEGHKMIVKVTNFHTYDINGTVSLILPEQIAAGLKSEEKLCVPSGSTKEIVFELDPKADAMGRMNAVMAKFDWGESSKCALASCKLPPAVSTHQLLYGTVSECSFPVGIHNITRDANVPVSISVCDANNNGNVIYSDEKTVEVAKGTYTDLAFDLKLPEGAYTVKTSAMGVESLTQLGIGADSGEVTLGETDLNGDGITEYVLENSKVKVTLLNIGARIIEYQVKGVDDNVFFRLWPEQPCDVNRSNRDWGFWPYGGFEDFLGQASVETHKMYEASVTRNDGKCAEVTMTANYYGNVLTKTFTLYGDSPLVGIRYAIDFVNPELNVIGPQPILVLGKTHGTEDKFIVPEMDGLKTYVMDPVNMYGRVIYLKEGWNAGYDTKENVSFVGAYPVAQPYYLHMWMNLEANGESHFPYTELQPWLPIFAGNTTFFSYYMWADGCPWQDSLAELRARNLVTER